jgi:phosphatidate cytidylyltransferase
MNNFVQRLVSSIALVIVIVFTLLAKIEVFKILLGILVFASAFEWHNLSTPKNILANSIFAIFASCLYTACVLLNFEWIVYFGAIFWLTVFVQLALYVKYPQPGVKPNYFVNSTIGLFVIVSTGYALATLREFGMEFIIALLVWVASMDVGGYIIGNKFGKIKLLEDVSPGKTIEGTVGGIFFVIISTIIMFYALELDSYLLIEYIIVGVIISLFASIGDLYESMIKRRFDVKDTGNIIPGHGGILDRIDSLTAAAPVLASLIFFMPS